MKQQMYEASIARTDDACHAHSEEVFFSRDSLLGPGEEPALASHLVTPRTLYSHHGIYVGNGRVIHYAGLAHGLRRGPVEEVSLELFARGHEVRVRHEPKCLDSCIVVERARSRLGEHRYRILTNNCVHFCAWALGLEGRSRQLGRLRAAMGTIYRAIRQQTSAALSAGVTNPGAQTPPVGVGSRVSRFISGVAVHRATTHCVQAE